jgi:hypothetical protein
VAFYELSSTEQIALTNSALAEKRTLTERWQALHRDEDDPWSERAMRASTLLSGCNAVADFGCGTMTLERYLEKGVDYQPIDIVARDDRTIVCDLNKDPLPEVGADGAACLGVVEYLFDVEAFFTRLAQFYPVAAISYCIADDGGPAERRRAKTWVNDLTRSEIEAAFSEGGFDITHAVTVGPGQLLWRLSQA